MKIIILFLMMVLFSSCDPVKRHARLVEKFPYVHQDSTEVKNDTTKITIPSIKVSDKIPISDLNVPFTIFKDRLKVEVQKVNDTLYLNAKCGDTVINNVTKTITRTIHSPLPKCPDKFNWWKLLFFGLLILGIVLYLKKFS